MLKLMYITNNPKVALIAQKYGVDRIWIDLETLGKNIRQKNMNCVLSNHTIEDIRKIKPLINQSELLVRINPINENSKKEIDDVIEAGADIIMLPMWKSLNDVKTFLNFVDKRVKTTLLLETKEAVECVDKVLEYGNFDEIHIGLNDLHLSYGLTFMFELLANGTIDNLCKKFKNKAIPFGFGGIAKLGEGLLPSENIIIEHYRLGSTRTILSRSFCNYLEIDNIDDIDNIFKKNLYDLKKYQSKIKNYSEEQFTKNKEDCKKIINGIVERMKNNETNN